MKVLAMIASLAALASAAVLPQSLDDRSGDGHEFNITNFYFTGSRGSIAIIYRFLVTDTLSGQSASCSWSTSSTPDFIPFDYKPCNNTAFSFAWLSAKDGQGKPGYSFQLAKTDGYLDQTACRFYPLTSIKRVEDPNPNLSWSYLQAPAEQLLAWDYKDKAECVYN